MPGYEYGKISIILDASGDVKNRLRILRLTPVGIEVEPGGTKYRRYNLDKLDRNPMPYVRELLSVMPGWRPCGTQGLLVRDSPSHAHDYAWAWAEYRFSFLDRILLDRPISMKRSLLMLTPAGPEVMIEGDWQDNVSPDEREAALQGFRAHLGEGWTLADPSNVVETYFVRAGETEALPASTGPAGASAHLGDGQARRTDPAEALRTLKRLLDESLISEAEYNAKKAEVLDRV